MKTAINAKQIRDFLAPLRSQRIAFVPTMGCLHAGHVSLIRKAKASADIVVVSIYVNPLQFGINEDFSEYPRTFEKDAGICRNEAVDFIFQPENLYPDGGSNITLKVNAMDHMLCGGARPGHFDGVVTVVNMLLNIIQPNIAIFGEKDWQQLAIIKRMVSDLHMPVEIIGSEIIREANGLAMSSRNRYLSPTELKQALTLSLALQLSQGLAQQGLGNDNILEQARQCLNAQHITTEYLEILDENSLQPSHQSQHQRLFIAAKIGQTRLIDNISLQQSGEKT
ncbi:MAG: pantoate--beta-alanine ligase [Mariprofundaceae bacterium]